MPPSSDGSETPLSAQTPSPPGAMAYLERAAALFDRHAFEEASQAYTQAIEARPALDAPRQAEAYFGRGACQRRLHRYAEAIADAERAVELMPGVARYHMALGYAHFCARDYAAALARLDAAAQLDPDEAWTYAYRGRAYLALGDTRKAVADCTAALSLDKNKALFYLWRAQAYATDGRYREAEADCTSGLNLAAGEARFWSQRAWARSKGLGDLAGALSDFTQSLRLRPEPFAYLGRGLVHRVLGAENAAARDFTQFVELHPAGAVTALKQLADLLQDGQT